MKNCPHISELHTAVLEARANARPGRPVQHAIMEHIMECDSCSRAFTALQASAVGSARRDRLCLRLEQLIEMLSCDVEELLLKHDPEHFIPRSLPRDDKELLIAALAAVMLSHADSENRDSLFALAGPMLSGCAGRDGYSARGFLKNYYDVHKKEISSTNTGVALLELTDEEIENGDRPAGLSECAEFLMRETWVMLCEPDAPSTLTSGGIDRTGRRLQKNTTSRDSC